MEFSQQLTMTKEYMPNNIHKKINFLGKLKYLISYRNKHLWSGKYETVKGFYNKIV